MLPTTKPNDRRIAPRLAVCFLCFVVLSCHMAGAETKSDSERLEKLERAVELLQKRNTELEAEVKSLKRQKSAPPAPLSAEKRSRFVPDSKSAVVEKTETTEEKLMANPDLLRGQVRAWIDARFDPGMALGSWLEVLADSGWAAPAWPAAWYGRDLPADQAAVAIAEFGAAGAPGPPAGLGTLLVAPTIVAHGSDELKRRYVRAILTGEHAWCQLFSEPGAGSDLASLATRAERDGEEYVLDGQKVWTSGAQVADYGLLLARTNAEAPKHRGITCFALRMDQPGVEAGPDRRHRDVAQGAEGGRLSLHAFRIARWSERVTGQHEGRRRRIAAHHAAVHRAARRRAVVHVGRALEAAGDLRAVLLA